MWAGFWSHARCAGRNLFSIDRALSLSHARTLLADVAPYAYCDRSRICPIARTDSSRVGCRYTKRLWRATKGAGWWVTSGWGARSKYQTGWPLSLGKRICRVEVYCSWHVYGLPYGASSPLILPTDRHKGLSGELGSRMRYIRSWKRIGHVSVQCFFWRWWVYASACFHSDWHSRGWLNRP